MTLVEQDRGPGTVVRHVPAQRLPALRPHILNNELLRAMIVTLKIIEAETPKQISKKKSPNVYCIPMLYLGIKNTIYLQYFIEDPPPPMQLIAI